MVMFMLDLSKEVVYFGMRWFKDECVANSHQKWHLRDQDCRGGAISLE